MSNSMLEVLARMWGKSVTLGWGAVAIYSRERLNRLLHQQYLDRLGGPRDLPLLTLELSTGTREATGGQPELVSNAPSLTSVSAKRVSDSRVHLSLDIDAGAAVQNDRASAPSTAISLTGIELGTPLLSFSTASVTNSRARLTMSIIAGTCSSINRDDSKLFSVFNFSEAMDFRVEIDVDLAMVTGSVDRKGRVTLDLAKGSSFRCNLFADNPALNAQLTASLAKWFKGLPARCSLFELGVIDLDGYGPLTPTGFILRTQAAPGAKVRSAINYGDGAVLVFIRVRADGRDGASPDQHFPYLLPDGDYSATLVISDHLLGHASEIDLVLLNSILFPASHEFIERERATPCDLAVFGNINPLRTTMTVQPSGRVIHAGEQVQFKLYDGTGREQRASRWSITGLTNHTAAAQGDITAKGLYSAPDVDHIGHESLTVLVTAEFDQGGETYIASARVQVAYERLQLMPRVVSFAPNQREIHLSAWETGGSGTIDWRLLGAEQGDLGVVDGHSAVFVPFADTTLRPLAVQQIQAKDSEEGTAALVMVNAQQLLALEPRFVPRLQSQASVKLAETSGMLSTLPKRWRIMAGKGAINQSGQFTASDNAQTQNSVVLCEVLKDGVVYATDYSVVQQSQLQQEPTWKSLKVHNIKVKGGANLGTTGALFPNGFQQLQIEVTVDTAEVDEKHYPLSIKELNSIRIFESAARQELPDLEDAEGIETAQLRWATRKRRNRFDPAITGNLLSSLPATKSDTEQTSTFYLHTLGTAGEIPTFYSGLQSDSNQWFYSNSTSDTNSKIEVTAKPLPDFTDDDLYSFKGYRVDGGGNYYELPDLPGHDDFYLFPRTVDYWKLKYKLSAFMTCEFVPSGLEILPPDVDGKLNVSTLSWENNHRNEQGVSFTGWIFYARTEEGTQPPTHVVFDDALQNQLPSSIDLEIPVDSKEFEVETLIITNHRRDDVSWIDSKKNDAIATLSREMAVRLRDRNGNLHQRKISFLPESIVGHRNHLKHSRFVGVTPSNNGDR